jgi:TetR/AcrR family transcriptional regulator, tetracycline repressor protein
VAEAALEIIDEDGLDGLSIERLAVRLEVRGPSLYYHFDSKADILAEVVRIVVSETVMPPRSQTKDWREWLVKYATSTRRAILKHPNAAGLLFEFYPRELLASPYGRTSHYLEQVDVPVELHAVIFEGLNTITFGSALQSARGRRVVSFDAPSAARNPARAGSTSNSRKDEAMFLAMLRAFLNGVGATSALPAG